MKTADEGIRFEGYTAATAQDVGIVPMNGKILVELVRFQMKDDGHLFLDATVEQATEHGVVIATADDVPLDFTPGQVLLFGRYSGYGVEEERYAMIRSEDVIGIRTRGVVKPKSATRADAAILVPDKRLLVPQH